jgi:HD-GYP domain-containing protein (c-di-GMP phosphodiesterase class II)
MEEYQKHVETGYRIALAVPEMKSIATEILYHHEHWDGSGYPKGLKGEEIPLLSRIICITDAYDELTRGAQRRTPYAIEKHFLTGAGTYYDPSILKSFFEMIHARL